MSFFLFFSLRRVAFTAVLVLGPWIPGLLAFPIVAMSSTPVFGREPAAEPEADGAAGPEDPAAGPEDETTGPKQLSGADYALATLPSPAGGELWVAVSTGEQRVWVFEGRTVVREMVASTGTEDKPTPLGTYHVQNRGDWFWSPKYGQGGHYWVSFLNWGEYLFHSVPTDRNGDILAEEAAKLGTPASHGCVRLALDDARWVYENLPAGARVEIY